MNQSAWQAELAAQQRATERLSEAAASRLAREARRGSSQRRPSRHSWTAGSILAHVHFVPLRALGPTRDAGRVERSGTVGQQLAVLLEAARTGNQAAWSELVSRCTAVLTRTARSYRLSDSDVADVVQLTWLRLIENLDRIREPRALNAWLVTTCRREAMRLVRTNSRTDPHDPRDPLDLLACQVSQDPWSDPIEVVLRDEVTAVVRSALEKLPPRQEQLLNELMSGHGEAAGAYIHVAAVLRIPVGSIGPTRQRAMRRLREDRTLLAFQAPQNGRASDRREIRVSRRNPQYVEKRNRHCCRPSRPEAAGTPGSAPAVVLLRE